MAAQPQAVVEEFFAALDELDLDRLIPMFAEDVEEIDEVSRHWLRGTLTTYDDSGKQIYAATYKATTPTSANDTSGVLDVVVAVGDFEPDGSIDGVVLILVSSGSNSSSPASWPSRSFT